MSHLPASYWIEDFSSSAEVEAILTALNKSIAENYIPGNDSNSKPGIILFSSATQIDQLVNCIINKKNSNAPQILAIAINCKSIDKALYWKLLQSGATDILCWDSLPFATEIISNRLNRCLSIERILNSSKIKQTIVGASEKLVRVLREVIEVALFSNSSVLVTGESGTGKELISNLIHQLDNRENKGQLTLVDCTTIVPELSGSEFFGHEKGAFTNAVSSRDGAFALANKGTLFLDEVGELPPSLQAELLRVIQEGTYKRIGSNIWKHTNFRLVCATNRDLQDEVNKQRFRQDLYFRLSGWIVQLPALHERTSDIPLLVEHFARQAMPDKSYFEIDTNLLDYLITREYKGNIRELKQLVNRIVLKHSGKGPLTLGMLPKDELNRLCNNESPSAAATSLNDVIRKTMLNGYNIKELKEMVGNIAIQMAIDQENGNLQKAAAKLGITDRMLQLWKVKMNGNFKNNTTLN